PGRPARAPAAARAGRGGTLRTRLNTLRVGHVTARIRFPCHGQRAAGGVRAACGDHRTAYRRPVPCGAPLGTARIAAAFSIDQEIPVNRTLRLLGATAVAGGLVLAGPALPAHTSALSLPDCATAAG